MKIMNEDMELVQYIKKRTGESLVATYSKEDKKIGKSDVGLVLVDGKTWTRIDFALNTVSKHILDTKWTCGKKNYALDMSSVDIKNEMRYFVFKDHESKDISYYFIWSDIIKKGKFETLSAQNVVLVPLEFVKSNSISIDELVSHYKKELAKVSQK